MTDQHAGSTDPTRDPEDVKREQEILLYAKFLRGSLKARMTYRLMRCVMILESIAWTLIDFLRAIRTRLAARINNNYQLYRKEKNEQDNRDA